MHAGIIYSVVIAWFTSAGIYFFLSRHIRYVYLVALSLVLSSLLVLGYFLADYFTGDGITDAVWFHLHYGLQSAGILAYPRLLVGTIVILFVLLAFTVLLIKRSSRSNEKVNSGQHSRQIPHKPLIIIAHGLLLYSLSANPAVSAVVGKLFWGGGPIDPILFSKNLHSIEFTPGNGKKKNLVYLYVESLEHTFFDQKTFPSLITRLRTLEQNALTFTNIQQAKLTGWTIAGMTASQCGMPMATLPGLGKNQDREESYSAGSSCLGDVLASNGYRLSFLGGANLSFAGKGRFYRSHGFSDVNGLTSFQEKFPDAPTSTWGIYDDMLLDSAYEKFITLSKGSQPFGLVALTLDTHQPSGHETPACRAIRYRDGSNKLLNSVACADVLVSSFINKVLASPYAKDTLLVVGSDHLALRNDATEYLERNAGKDRRNLLLVFNSGLAPQIILKPGTTLDIAPTVLHLLGFVGGDFALGRDLLGTGPTLVEKMGIKRLNVDLPHWRNSDLGAILKQAAKN